MFSMSVALWLISDQNYARTNLRHMKYDPILFIHFLKIIIVLIIVRIYSITLTNTSKKYESVISCSMNIFFILSQLIHKYIKLSFTNTYLGVNIFLYSYLIGVDFSIIDM